ncbi:hypothetical protein IKG28_01165 [Candidatus Saccharibacteria bacterium]|nr:hypothetical protein [Candidatus Saccharibacteria bacterium]
MKSKGEVIIPAGCKPWPHELRVASILAAAGHHVEFVPEANLHTADIALNGIKYEIKSPKSSLSNSLEHILKKALKQSPNIIIDTSRMKYVRDNSTRNFLITQAKSRKQIKSLLMISKQNQIIDIKSLI